MAEEDQASRKMVGDARRNDASDSEECKLWDRVNRLDRAHTREMKAIIRKIGWPTASAYGHAVYDAAHRLVLHSLDVEFQKACLDLFKRMSDMDIMAWDYAYLQDQILVNRELPQKYGTQFRRFRNGKVRPYPIRNKAEVDERRELVGLCSLAQQWEQTQKEQT